MYIEEFRLKDDIDPKDFNEYPLNIPALRGFVSLRFSKNVTIFCGDNGSGKSTVIETIAAMLDLPVAGGNKNMFYMKDNSREEEESELAHYAILARGYKRPFRTFFFRAESFYDLASFINSDEGIDYAQGSNYQTMNLLLQSHGESFMDLIKQQFVPGGLYLMDEPESALSPYNQLELVRSIDQLAKNDTQFIIASHSPFILGYRDAKLIDVNDGMKSVTFKDTKIYKMYKDFLDKLKMQGVTEELYLQYANTTAEDVKSKMREEANTRIKYRYLLKAVIKEEKLKVTDKQVEKEIDTMAKTYGVTKEDILKEIKDVEYIKLDMLIRKAIEVIKGNE